MTTSPHTDDLNRDPANLTLRDALATEASRIEEDAIFSAKGHFQDASLWSNVQYLLGIPATLLAALSGGLAAGGWTNPAAAGVLSIAAAGLTALLTFLHPNERSNSHHFQGTEYLELRNRARVLRAVDVRTDKSDHELRNQLDVLLARRHELNRTSLPISRLAFTQARRGIEEGESSYRVDASAS